MKLGDLLERVTSDGHIPCGLFIFVVGSVIHWFHGLDASFVAFTSTVLAFLGGHAWTQARYPDVIKQAGTQAEKDKVADDTKPEGQ